MRKLMFMLLLLLVGVTSYAQNYERNGKTFVSTQTSDKVESNKTDYIWKDSKGIKYPIYISKNGSCFVYKTSKKTGKEYKYYLGPEISQEICKELGIEYKGKRT